MANDSSTPLPHNNPLSDSDRIAIQRGDDVSIQDLERESRNCPFLYRMFREADTRGVGVYVVMTKYLMALSRIRRNWIEAELSRRRSEELRRVTGETYEIPEVRPSSTPDPPTFIRLR